MDTRVRSFLLIALIVGCLGYFYSKDKNAERAPASPTLSPETSVKETLPKKEESSSTTATTKNFEGSAESISPETTQEFTVSEEERARIQSEIKTSLASMYVAQKAFYAEYGRYSTDLKAIGWDPLDGEVNVKIGFTEPATGIADLAQDENLEARIDSDYLTSLTHDPISGDKVSYQYSKFAQDISLKALSQHCRRGCSATTDRFEIIAVSKIGPNGEPDVWIIDDDKNIIHATE